MLRTRISQAFLIGLLASGATFCALAARGAEPAEGHRTYSIVSQSDATSAATGRLPLAKRIASSNLPIRVVPQPGTAQPTGAAAGQSPGGAMVTPPLADIDGHADSRGLVPQVSLPVSAPPGASLGIPTLAPPESATDFPRPPLPTAPAVMPPPVAGSFQPPTAPQEQFAAVVESPTLAADLVSVESAEPEQEAVPAPEHEEPALKRVDAEESTVPQASDPAPAAASELSTAQQQVPTVARSARQALAPTATHAQQPAAHTAQPAAHTAAQRQSLLDRLKVAMTKLPRPLGVRPAAAAVPAGGGAKPTATQRPVAKAQAVHPRSIAAQPPRAALARPPRSSRPESAPQHSHPRLAQAELAAPQEPQPLPPGTAVMAAPSLANAPAMAAETGLLSVQGVTAEESSEFAPPLAVVAEDVSLRDRSQGVPELFEASDAPASPSAPAVAPEEVMAQEDCQCAASVSQDAQQETLEASPPSLPSEVEAWEADLAPMATAIPAELESVPAPLAPGAAVSTAQPADIPADDAASVGSGEQLSDDHLEQEGAAAPPENAAVTATDLQPHAPVRRLPARTVLQASPAPRPQRVAVEQRPAPSQSLAPPRTSLLEKLQKSFGSFSRPRVLMANPAQQSPKAAPARAIPAKAASAKAAAPARRPSAGRPVELAARRPARVATPAAAPRMVQRQVSVEAAQAPVEEATPDSLVEIVTDHGAVSAETTEPLAELTAEELAVLAPVLAETEPLPEFQTESPSVAAGELEAGELEAGEVESFEPLVVFDPADTADTMEANAMEGVEVALAEPGAFVVGETEPELLTHDSLAHDSLIQDSLIQDSLIQDSPAQGSLLALEVESPPQAVGEGEAIVLRISVRNLGSEPASAVTATMYFAEGIEPVTATGHAADIYPGQVRFNTLQALPAGEVIELMVTAVGTRPGSMAFRGEVDCQELTAALAADGELTIAPRAIPARR